LREILIEKSIWIWKLKWIAIREGMFAQISEDIRTKRKS
jgi:hypothetical protein